MVAIFDKVVDFKSNNTTQHKTIPINFSPTKICSGYLKLIEKIDPFSNVITLVVPSVQ